MTRSTVLRIVVLALLIAVVVHMLTIRRGRAADFQFHTEQGWKP